MLKKSLLLLVSCLAASGACAQQMYKSVGADGKVTFSDRPAYEKTKKLSVMKSYTLRPVTDFKAADDKPAARTGPVTDPKATVTPEVEEAMVTVMGLSEFGSKHANMCSANPAVSKAFGSATAKWRQRNGQYIEHQKRLLMEVVSPNKRAELQDRAAVYLAELAKSAPPVGAQRDAWCSGTIAEMESGQSDINKPTMLLVPIKKYRAPN